jgi:cellulose synthase/poly-beta-1,6-N-acetylglucosamine synthase-like glycosyltransferase
MTKQLRWIIGGLAAIIALLLFPFLHIALVVGNLAVHLVVLGLQLITSRFPSVRPSWRASVREPFVSIQVPAHNEPPELLRETLMALSRLRWNNYEVLVIDNNTTDEHVWRPVAELCSRLGPRFKFFHVENLKGAKAGALNHVRAFMDPRAEFVFVVDADYVIEPDALERALGYVADDRIGLIQFPQEYRNIGSGNTGLALDFKHFFAGYMNMANHLGCVPSTGTLSLIRVTAMKAVGGFDTNVVTEDAEIGFRLNAAGYRSLYVNDVIGRGLMPHDLESLKKQRWRWAFGNAQILRLNWRKLLFGRGLGWRQKLGYLIHLTAWFNFNLIPCLSLILVGVLAFFHKMQAPHPYIAIVSWFTLATFTVLRFGTLFYSLRRAGHRPGEIWLAYFTHLGLGWICSVSWLKCVFTPQTPFLRTNKFLTPRVPGMARTVLMEMSLGIALLMACVMLTVSDFVFSPVLAMIMGITQFFVLWVGQQVRHTFGITRALQVGNECGEHVPAIPTVLPRL